jgi:hypothetical protein
MVNRRYCLLGTSKKLENILIVKKHEKNTFTTGSRNILCHPYVKKVFRPIHERIRDEAEGDSHHI